MEKSKVTIQKSAFPLDVVKAVSLLRDLDIDKADRSVKDSELDTTKVKNTLVRVLRGKLGYMHLNESNSMSMWDDQWGRSSWSDWGRHSDDYIRN